ncbi:MAG: hypothetical protein IJY46_00255 [Lentisphaeria bacterium]|nr:hypothetical protein [Lentisphaeria bacterium]
MKNQNRFRSNSHIGILDDYRFRIVLLSLLILVAFTLLILRAYYLQLHHGEEHRERIARQSIRRIRIPGWRGSIYSADGELLAGNRTVYDLVFYPEGMRTGGGIRRTIDSMYNAAKELAEVSGRKDFPDREEIRRHINNTPGMPLLVFRDLDPKERARILERSRNMKGLELQISAQRIYPGGQLAAHIIGYSRKAEANSAADREEFFYYQPDIVGKAGVELVCDRLPQEWNASSLGLCALPGRQVVQVSNVGFVHKELLGRVEPVHGNDVYLTIDSRAQKIAESLLAGKNGSLIVMDADNGDIICAATAPSYDLRRFTPRLSPEYYRSLLDSPGRPLINRATGGIYPPGSTLKPLICLALLKSGIDPKEKIFCSGSIEVKNTTIRCLAHRYSEADVDMGTALEKSCNTYMIHQSLRVGLAPLQEILSLIGAGEKSGIEIGESAGTFPEPARKKQLYRIPWNDSDTAMLSIGQGFIAMTPLQMVRYTAALCNGGKLYRPHIIHQVCDRAGETVYQRQRVCTGTLEIAPEKLDIVRNGMFRVVNAPRGSGRRGKVANLTVYGKTGTAEFGLRNKSRNMTHFIAFTSYKLRKYALAVTIEDGDSGGGSCAPLAAAFFERFLKPEAAPSGAPSTLEDTAQ